MALTLILSNTFSMITCFQSVFQKLHIVHIVLFICLLCFVILMGSISPKKNIIQENQIFSFSFNFKVLAQILIYCMLYNSQNEPLFQLLFHMSHIWVISAKNVPIFFDGKIQISINISIDGLQPTCRYQSRVSRGPYNFSLGHALVELV